MAFIYSLLESGPQPAQHPRCSKEDGRPGPCPGGRGDVAEGVPERQYQIEPSLFGLRKVGTAFVVKVRGRSMEGAGIQDGDLAVLEKREAKPGEVVAALLDGEVTLKRLMGSGRNLFLQSENPDYPDLRPRRDMEIQGVLVGLVRRWQS